MNRNDRDERKHHDGGDFEKEQHRPSIGFLPLSL